jgi:hypothetical protein
MQEEICSACMVPKFTSTTTPSQSPAVFSTAAVQPDRPKSRAKPRAAYFKAISFA